jgi:hypothetical protein
VVRYSWLAWGLIERSPTSCSQIAVRC